MLAARAIRSVLIGLLVPGLALFAKEPSDLQLFLLIGQSNMAGRGKVEPADQAPHPRIVMLDKANVWVPAADPVHFDKPKIAGVGLCSEFARRVAAAEPQAAVGLVPCAFGGTRLDQWLPGTALYTNAVARACAAMRSGRLRAILWHQGEGDSSPAKSATYPARFSGMIAQLRTDLVAQHWMALSRDDRARVTAAAGAAKRRVEAARQALIAQLEAERRADIEEEDDQ